MKGALEERMHVKAKPTVYSSVNTQLISVDIMLPFPVGSRQKLWQSHCDVSIWLHYIFHFLSTTDSKTSQEVRLASGDWIVASGRRVHTMHPHSGPTLERYSLVLSLSLICTARNRGPQDGRPTRWRKLRSPRACAEKTWQRELPNVYWTWW